MRSPRPFSKREDEKIEALRLEGTSLTEIARLTDRHRSTILRRLMYLAALAEEDL